MPSNSVPYFSSLRYAAEDHNGSRVYGFPNAVFPKTFVPQVWKFVGDSRFAGATDDTATAVATAEVALNDLVNINNGPQWWAQYFAGGLVEVEDYSVIGSWLSITAGRTDDVLTGQLPLALASGYPANEVIILCSSVNDRIAGGSLRNQLDTLKTFVERVIRSGRRAIICLEPPQKDIHFTAQMQSDWSALVEYQFELAAQYSATVLAVDWISLVMAATGEARSSSDSWLAPYYDNIHPRMPVACWWGYGIVQTAQHWLPEGGYKRAMAADIALGAANIAPNPTLSGNSGTLSGVAGTVADNWNLADDAGTSWTGGYIMTGNRYLYQPNLAVVAGDVVESLLYPDFQYMCLTAGTTHSAGAALSQTLFADTSEGGGTVTWKTIPRFNGFDGIRWQLLYGTGNETNRRGYFRFSETLVNLGLEIGQYIRGGLYVASLLPTYGFSSELRAMTGGVSGTKVRGAHQLAQSYPNSRMYPLPPLIGKLKSAKSPGHNGFLIPATTDAIRYGMMSNSYSVNSTQQCYAIACPSLVVTD